MIYVDGFTVKKVKRGYHATFRAKADGNEWTQHSGTFRTIGELSDFLYKRLDKYSVTLLLTMFFTDIKPESK